MKSFAIPTMFACYVTTILVSLFLAGCSGTPSESVGRQIVEKKVQDESGGLMKLVSFRKINATGDSSMYSMEYEAEIVFTDDAIVYEGEAIMGPFWARRGSSRNVFNTSAMLTGGRLIEKRKGERMNRAGTLTFEKTEKGWRRNGIVY
ncbi:MAG: hypothetical protein Q7U03_12035 [Syntrophales bacterium]|nr:hypothetical protein [Syntrophales bacterium]